MQSRLLPTRLLRRLIALLLWPLLAFAPAFASVPDRGLLMDPVMPACVSSPYGPRVLPNRPLAGTFHNGIDLPAPLGAPVRAVAPGVVIRAQRHGPGGLELLVQHVGFIGIYSHLGTVAPIIAEGRRVVFGGEQLGVVGHSGVMYGSHLFFGMILDGRTVDPAPYLAVAPCDGAPRTAQAATTRRFAADGKLLPSRTYVAMQKYNTQQ